MATGDVTFYHGESFWDRQIQRATQGPWSHVAVSVGDGMLVEAVSTGIRKRPSNLDRGVRGVLLTSKLCIPARLMGAVDYVESRVGQRYGWDDIFNDGLKTIWPSAPALTWSDRWDCSNLVARFLVLAGYPITPDLLDFTHVSPNSLFRALDAIQTKAGDLYGLQFLQPSQV